MSDEELNDDLLQSDEEDQNARYPNKNIQIKS